MHTTSCDEDAGSRGYKRGVGDTLGEIRFCSSSASQAVRESTLDVEAAETQILEFIKLHVPIPLTGNLAGSSVHMDLAFLRRYMPRIAAYCSHRYCRLFEFIEEYGVVVL